jgi:hypothetical protein
MNLNLLTLLTLLTQLTLLTLLNILNILTLLTLLTLLNQLTAQAHAMIDREVQQSLIKVTLLFFFMHKTY